MLAVGAIAIADDRVVVKRREHLMCQVLLRQTAAATMSADEVLDVVCNNSQARLIARAGRNLLIECAPGELDPLRERLLGWLVVEQRKPIPVPNTRLHPKER